MNNLKSLLNKPFAHRGLHNKELPENSLSAIMNAFRNNLNCEIDVRLTKDCKVIVFHDNSLLRMCGVNKYISETDYSELQTFSLNKTDEKIPLLKDVLDLFPTENTLLIELKNMSFNYGLETEVIKLINSCSKNILLQSFNPYSVINLKKRTKKFAVGFITSNFQDEKINPIKKYLLTRKNLIKIIKPDFISLDINYADENLISLLKRMNVPILTWTIDSAEKLETANQFADNIIFERINYDFFKRS